MEEKLYRIWLHNTPGMNTYIFRTLITNFNSAKQCYNSSYEELKNVIGEKHAAIIIDNRNLDVAKQLNEKLIKENISIIYPGCEVFPDKLEFIPDRPELLYIKGKLPPNINSIYDNVAIVGSRMPDSYGKEYSYYFARELALNNFNIISGLAKGIDAQAHKGALSVGGYTIAVLGCGLNHIYPRENYKLYMEIEESGAIISEYPLDTPPLSPQFPERNRIISALSDGVLVVQAKKKSGSLITCNHALSQGKPIYAIPGRISDALSEGTNALIYDGATCTTCPADIIETIRNELISNTDTDNFETITSLSQDEKSIIEHLSLDELYIDRIIELSGLGVTKTINTLLSLKEKGVIKEPYKGYYIKNILFKSI